MSEPYHHVVRVITYPPPTPSDIPYFEAWIRECPESNIPDNAACEIQIAPPAFNNRGYGLFRAIFTDKDTK